MYPLNRTIRLRGYISQVAVFSDGNLRFFKQKAVAEKIQNRTSAVRQEGPLQCHHPLISAGVAAIARRCTNIHRSDHLQISALALGAMRGVCICAAGNLL